MKIYNYSSHFPFHLHSRTLGALGGAHMLVAFDPLDTSMDRTVGNHHWFIDERMG